MYDDAALTSEIALRLDMDHQYTEIVPQGDQERVDAIRRCGRAAARALRWRVRTGAVETDGGGVAVWVVIIESTPSEEARIAERGQVLLNHLFDPDN